MPDPSHPSTPPTFGPCRVQLEKIRNDAGNNTDNWLNIIGIGISCTPYLLMALGAASRMNICLDIHASLRHPVLCNGYVIFLMASAAIWFLVYMTIVLRHHWMDLVRRPCCCCCCYCCLVVDM